jgi:hypothetical protein
MSHVENRHPPKIHGRGVNMSIKISGRPSSFQTKDEQSAEEWAVCLWVDGQFDDAKSLTRAPPDVKKMSSFAAHEDSGLDGRIYVAADRRVYFAQEYAYGETTDWWDVGKAPWKLFDRYITSIFR